MASQPDSDLCFADAPLAAQDVARGVTRLFFGRDHVRTCAKCRCRNGRRADMVAIDADGRLTIVEIKVSRADLLGDGKWPDYLDYCDRFFWAVPAGFGLAPFDGDMLRPDCAGLIVADRYDAAVIRRRRIARWRARAARPRRCASPAAPRGGSPAISIPGLAGLPIVMSPSRGRVA